MTSDSEGHDYWSLILAMTGEMSARKVADRILQDHPDLTARAYWASLFAFNVKAGLPTAEALRDEE